VLATRDEPGPSDAEARLLPAIREGRRLHPAVTVEEARQRFEADLAWLPEGALHLRDPIPEQCRLGPALRQLGEDVRAGYRATTGAAG
jgi:nicotinate phosphoribosyltransferase